MGVFDYVSINGDISAGYQSKDGPRELRTIERDEVDENGAYVINRYHGKNDEGVYSEWRRGPEGWVDCGPRSTDVSRATDALMDQILEEEAAKEAG